MASFQRFGGLPINFNIYQLKNENAFIARLGSTNYISLGLRTLYCTLQPPKPRAETRTKFVIEVVAGCLSFLPPKSRKSLSELVWQVWRRSTSTLILLIFPKRYFEKLDTMKFYGTTFNIPSDVENLLKYRYGEWRKPDKEWEMGRGHGVYAYLVERNKISKLPI
jgi:hypothetical protein